MNAEVTIPTDLQTLMTQDSYPEGVWVYAKSGRCGWASPQFLSIERCGALSDPTSTCRYCAGHRKTATAA